MLLNLKEPVLSLKEKQNTTLMFLLSNCPRVLTVFYDWFLTISVHVYLGYSLFVYIFHMYIIS